MRPMNKWFTDVDEGNGYVVAHYVGGEEGCYVYDWYNTSEEARQKADALNNSNITYGFNCHEGECTINISPANWRD